MNKNYIIVENGLFKDSFTEEAVINKELQQRVISKSRRAGFSGSTLGIPFYTGTEEYRQFQEVVERIVQDSIALDAARGHTPVEEIYIDLRPEVDLSVMTEQEIINDFDTISNEQQ